MTRREFKKAKGRLDELEQETQSDGMIVGYRDPQTGDLEDADGNPIHEDEHAGLLVAIERTLVLPREQAEREGHTILEPAEDAAGDVVRVAR